MPVITETMTPAADGRVTRVSWLAMANGDTGRPVNLSVHRDLSAQIFGTFGAGGSVTMQGSNDGGTTWSTVSDTGGNALTFTTAGIKQFGDTPYQVRPSVTAGDGTTAIDVWLHARGDR